MTAAALLWWEAWSNPDPVRRVAALAVVVAAVLLLAFAVRAAVR